MKSTFTCLNLRFGRLGGWTALAWLLALLPGLAAAGPGQPGGPGKTDATRSIATVLQPDGSLQPGATGAFNPSGFRLETAPDGRPTFRPLSTNGTGDDKWQNGFGGSLNGTNVLSVVQKGTDLFVAGRFTRIGGVTVANVARWDGTAWHDVGGGTNALVWSLAVLGNDVYAGGEFTVAGGVAAKYVAKWDGTSWSALGSGAGANVTALAVMGTDLYVGGFFLSAGGITTRGIARWNGSAWSKLDNSLNPGLGNGGAVSALATDGSGNLYIGGRFNSVGGVGALNVAKWSGSAWSTLGAGVGTTSESVSTLAVNGSTVYAGGSFETAGGVSAKSVARWNGSAWSSLGTGLTDANNFPSLVYSLAVSGTTVYATGSFVKAGGANISYLARWNGSSWSALGSGIDNWGYSLRLLANGNLIVGGGFTTAGGAAATKIARWNGSAWSSLGSGVSGTSVNDYINALAVASNGDLYAGGYFTQAGNVSATKIAKWNGTDWSALGAGMTGGGSLFNGPEVFALTAGSGSDLYAGGAFTVAGGVTVNHIAKWNGSAWSALGAGLSGSVGFSSPTARALAIAPNGDLYVGGSFTTAGSVAASNIARWNGASWSALGSGVDGTVFALAFDGSGNLYVSGNFTNAGGAAANYVAKWNGTSWSSLGTGTANGMDSAPRAVAVRGSEVYFGGSFTLAGGMSATGLARWNGTAWSTVTGAPGGIRTMAFNGSDLYVGGQFGFSTPQYNVAKWSGSAWSSLGTGLGTTSSTVQAMVNALLMRNDKLYAGGTFNIVGDGSKATNYFGAYEAPAAPTLTSFTPLSGVVGTPVTLTGTGFTGATGVSFNGTAAPGFTVVSATQITVTVPSGANSGAISVTTPGGTAASTQSFTFYPAPTLTGLTPDRGPVATGVTLTGTGFTGATSVSFSGQPASFTVVSATQITTAVPAGASSGTVSVTTPGGTATSAAAFTVIPAPQLTGFTPPSGPVGTSVELSGTNLSGATAVSFNGTSAPGFVVNSPTSISVRVPTGASSGPISVTTPGGTASSSSSYSLTVAPVPAVTAVSGPANGGYALGGTLDFVVSFDQVISVSGTPTLPLNIGQPGMAASYYAGNGSATLMFRYTVSGTDLDLDGIQVGTALSLNGGSLTNAAGTAADLTLRNVASLSGVVVDGERPYISTSVRHNPNTATATGPEVTFRVSYNEAVTGVVPACFVAVGTNGVGGTVSTVVPVAGSNGRSYDVTFTGVNGDGTLRLSAPATGPVVRDAFQNNYLASSSRPGETYTIIPGNLTVSTPQTISGTYANVTISGGGVATLSGPLYVTGSFTVRSGGWFSSWRRRWFRPANGSATPAATATCGVVSGPGSFVLEPGATLSICDPAGISSSGSTGAVQVTGTRTFAADAHYVYEGEAAQATGSGLPAQVRELTVATTGGNLTLTSSLAIGQVLRLAAGNAAEGNLDLAGRTLTLRSGAAGTALLVNGGGGQVLASTGTCRMERAIDPVTNAGAGYRHFASPVTGMTIADLATTGFTPVLTQAYNTSATPNGVTPFPNVFGYDQARLSTSPATGYSDFDKGWMVPTAATPMDPATGYTVNLRPSSLVTFTGTGFTQTDATRPLSGSGPQADAGWVLTGNPFPSGFDLSVPGSTSRVNVDAANYVFESTSQYNGQYRSYVNGFGNPLLAAGQAFFVRMSAPGQAASLSFAAAGRQTSFGTQQPFRRGAADVRPQVRLSLRVGSFSDDAYVYAEAGATDGVDSGFDALKLPNSNGLSVAALTSTGVALAIQGLPALTASTVVPLQVLVPAAGPASFTASVGNLPAGLIAYLHDAVTGTRQDLTTAPSYAFTAPQAGAQAGRFTLVFGATGVLSTRGGAAELALYPNPARHSATLSLPATAQARPVLVLDALGRVVRTGLLPAAASRTVLPLNGLPTGVYTVRCAGGAARLVVE